MAGTSLPGKTMTATHDQILEALRSVIDPELHRPIVDLGLVQDIEIDRKKVVVTVGVPVLWETWGEHVTRRIHEVLAGVADVGRVEVVLEQLDEDEDAELAKRLCPVDEQGNRLNPFTDARTRVVAVSSGKGGVGKSSVTVNLAVALAQRGHQVAVLDADVWGFSIPRMLGVTRGPGVVDRVIIPPESYGVRYISIGFFASEDEGVVWRGPMLHKALEQFITDVYWDEPKFLLIDMPPGTGDVALSIAQFLPRAEVLIVTTPQPAAQSVAQRAATMAKKVRLSVVGVIENMSWFRGDDGKAYEIFGEGGGAALADKLGVPLLGQVPLVPELREGGDVGRPIVVDDPTSEPAAVFAEIARRLDEELAPRKVFRKELKLK
jgi:ATP-binding protein involved in chromosome partitioning